MKSILRYLSAGILVALALPGMGQGSVTMSNGTFQTCAGALFDSGGQGNPGYSNGEYFVTTICPETEGDVISIVFNTFNLDQSGPQNSWDNMAIYDGNSTGEASLGVYTGNQLSGLTVSATPLNTSGCLTLVFTSNNQGTGSFGGSITCETPCDRPTAVATYDAPADKKICVGDVITFDGTGSYAADGFTISEWLWEFGDGTTFDGPGPIQHSWDTPGEYVVELYLVDNNGCSSTNLVSLQVLVSTFPSWDPFPSDFSICLGEEVSLEAFPDDYEVTWAGPDISYSNPNTLTLPDDVGVPQESEIFVTGFAPGQTLNNVNDLMSIDISIEHSFLFDLVITVTCPSGESAILHQQMAQPGGGNVGSNGTDLGVPDTEYYDYQWVPNAPQGTWSQVATGLGFGALPEGQYTSLQPLDQLVGCDLNGIWQITIVDMWGGDNGELAAWGLSFNPSILPDVTEFTPDIGAGADSSYWIVPTLNIDLLSESADGNAITALPTAPGLYDFTYYMVNDHGCEFEETVTVDVYLAMQADAGEDVTVCGPGTELQGGLNGMVVPQCGSVSGNYDYCYGNGENLELTYCPDNPGDGLTFMTITFNAGSTENFWDPFYIYDGDNTNAPILAGPLYGNLGGQSWTATNPSGCLTIGFTSDGSVSCTSGSQTEWNYDVTCTDLPDYIYEWSPAEYLSDASIPNPEIIEIPGETTFTLTVYPNGSPACASTDEVLVSPSYEFEMSIQEASCNGNDGVISCDVDPNGLGGGPWTVSLTLNGGLVDEQATNGGLVVFNGLGFGDYTCTISDASGCSYSTDYEIDAPPPMVFQFDGPGTICIDELATISCSSNMDPDGSWEYTWDNGLGVAASVDVSPPVTTTYSVFATDEFGCVSQPQEYTLNVRDPLQVEIAGPIEICINTEAAMEVTSAQGGLEPYTYNWTFEGAPVGQGETINPTQTQTGVYCVTMTDACTTPPVNACFEVLVEPVIVPEFAADTTRGCVPQTLGFTILNDPATYAEAFWTFGNGEGSSQFEPFTSYVEPGVYNVSLELTTPTGCVHLTEVPGYIRIWPNPVAGFFATPQPANLLDTEITFQDQSSEGVIDWNWIFGVNSNGGLGMSNEQNPIYEFPLGFGGEYPVRLTVTDENNCTGQVTKTIVIDELLNVFVPNAFTPNNDGVNDVLFVQGTDIDPDRYELRIFNRWGEKVFESTNINEPWDGSVNNGDYYGQNEVYTWQLIVYSLTTVERYELSGSVVVMR